MAHAVAVDFGASSGRIALGEMVDGRIKATVVKQILHEAKERNGLLRWDLDLLMGLCREAVSLAETIPGCSLGIDSWGVDHGFIGHDGQLLDAPVCYRDLSHLAAFESLKPERARLYRLTGIQHQPFNTICQLAARKKENPNLPSEIKDWMILPDLLGYLLGGNPNSELTQCSTTQLLGIDGNWSPGAFEIAGWPVPDRMPSPPGVMVNRLESGVRLMSVGSHDTASAVLGFGNLSDREIFLNVGTWTLAGCVLESPLVSPRAEVMGFTNERMVDGRIRFLKNIPGFYFINRLHSELGITSTVPEWLRSAVPVGELLDLFHPDFFNPSSMVETCRTQLRILPIDLPGWAGLALQSLAKAVGQTRDEITELTGRTYQRIRVGGGGSQSKEFCVTLASMLQAEVIAGPVESTVLGNLAAQFLAQGAVEDWKAAAETVEASLALETYRPA